MNLRQSFLHDPLGLVEGLSHPGHLMGTLSLNLQSCTSVQERDRWGGGGVECQFSVNRVQGCWWGQGTSTQWLSFLKEKESVSLVNIKTKFKPGGENSVLNKV